MDQIEFERVVNHIGERIDELRAAVGHHQDVPARVTEAALEELATSLEELTIAEEELRRQSIELAQVHAQVEAERRRYQDMYWTAPHAYVTTDARGVIHEVNRSASELFGASALGLYGKPLGLLVTLEDRPRFDDWLRALRGSSEAATSGELRCHTLTRTAEFPCGMRVSRIDGPLERRDALRWSLANLSERDLARESGRLREEARRKDEFMAILGHELRNPLSAIAMAVEVVESEAVTGRARWGIEIVKRHGDHLRQLIDDLLDISRVSHGKIALKRAPLDLDVVVERALEGFDHRRRHIVVERSPDPLVLDGDAVRLRQVVANLVDNATRFSSPGSTIRVSTRRVGSDAWISVRDAGIGIAPDRLQQIFAMFEPGAGPSGGRSTGLGLALALQLTELHGGSVEARSDGIGKGSEFIVRLPLLPSSATSASPAPATPAAVSEAAGTGPLRVLLADDNEDAAQILGLCLERLGHRVQVVHDGAAAIAASQAEVYDVAVLDLGMPIIDGFDVARLLRAARPAMFLVALTGYGDASNRATAREAGFDHYVVKPITVTELDRMLRRHGQLALLS